MPDHASPVPTTPVPTAPVPTNSLIFGIGPLVPLLAAAVAAWLTPHPWPIYATRLAIIWGALVLSFIAGVRRGFGFGRPTASTVAEITAMLIYFVLAGLALIVPHAWVGLLLLALGFALAAVLDWRAARTGDAPAHFARLRPPQCAVASAACLALAGAAWMPVVISVPTTPSHLPIAPV